MHIFCLKPQVFADRFNAGEVLGSDLKSIQSFQDAVVIGLARGGVPVAYSVAKVLGLPLDVLVIRKLGVPWQPELAFGALAPDGVKVLNRNVIIRAQLSDLDMFTIQKSERAVLERREARYRAGLTPLFIRGRTVILVDDGLATGATMDAALEWAEKKGASECVIAIPVASLSACQSIEQQHNKARCFCHIAPESFYSVGSWYRAFTQVQDKTVLELLEKRRAELQYNIKNFAQ